MDLGLALNPKFWGGLSKPHVYREASGHLQLKWPGRHTLKHAM